MPENRSTPGVRLVTHRFVTEKNLQPALREGPGIAGARLFEVEGDAPSWLAWYEGPDSLDAASSMAWTDGALQLEAMAFDLCRDVSNESHRHDDTRWLYVVHTDVPDDVAAEYNDWYDSEHLPRLARVPGIVRARRYVACEGHPRYFTAYDLADRDAFTSPRGLEARKTPWTERMRNLFSNTRRFTGRLVIPQSSF